jgi:hypothetical protein
VSGRSEELDALAADALALAVARYLAGSPEARERVPAAWLGRGADAWSRRTVAELEAEADHRLAVLGSWELAARELDPALWEERRVDAVIARLQLEAARSGAFGSAAGALADFLRDAGAAPARLDVH